MPATPRSAAETVAALTLQLHYKTDEYKTVAVDYATAKAAYVTEHAKRKLQAKADGEHSESGAKTIADADPYVAELHLNSLIGEALTKATDRAIDALQERIGYGRSLMADQREADKLLATNREIT
jgi:hypothetical protein